MEISGEEGGWLEAEGRRVGVSSFRTMRGRVASAPASDLPWASESAECHAAWWDAVTRRDLAKAVCRLWSATASATADAEAGAGAESLPPRRGVKRSKDRTGIGSVDLSSLVKTIFHFSENLPCAFTGFSRLTMDL